MTNITVEEKNRISDSNLHLFVERHIHDYWPSKINSQRMVDFLEGQFGMSLEAWPYPLHLEQIEMAFAYLNSQHMLFPRPEEEEVVDEAVVEEARKQQQVRDNYAARQRAAQAERDRTMDIKELGAKVSRQNAQFRAQRDQNILPGRPVGQSSRSLGAVTMGIKATARANVALANPSLDRNGSEFSRLCAAEVARLSGE
jgi:hypothetical protein